MAVCCLAVRRRRCRLDMKPCWGQYHAPWRMNWASGRLAGRHTHSCTARCPAALSRRLRMRSCGYWLVPVCGNKWSAHDDRTALCRKSKAV
eukprot:2971655-Prymnesium_polylepis.2